MTPFNVKAADNKVLTFKLAWYFNATASAADDSKIEIVASTTVTNETITEPSVWTVVKTIEYKEGVNEINVYFDESADLSAYAASDKVYVAFRYVGHIDWMMSRSMGELPDRLLSILRPFLSVMQPERRQKLRLRLPVTGKRLFPVQASRSTKLRVRLPTLRLP